MSTGPPNSRRCWGYEALGLEKFLPPATLEICRPVNIQVKCYGEREKKKLGKLLAADGELFYLPSLNRNKVSLIRSVIPDAVVFRISRNERDTTPQDEFLDLMLRHGVRLADEFIRENKPKVRKQEIATGEIALHSAGTTYHGWGRFQTVRRHVQRAEADCFKLR